MKVKLTYLLFGVYGPVLSGIMASALVVEFGMPWWKTLLLWIPSAVCGYIVLYEGMNDS